MKAGKQRRLGKGLGALLMEKPTDEISGQSRNILISTIKPNPYQPRRLFREDELASLTESIRKEGVISPILLRRKGDGYELIAGERRWRASQAAGLPEIPAIIRIVSDAQALELAIIENEQRDDLTAVESGRAYRRLMDEFNYTQQKVSEQLGISRTQVSNLIRLLKLPEQIQHMIENKNLDMGHARTLVGLSDDHANSLATLCVQNGWSVRKMEQEAKRVSKQKKEKPISEPDADIIALEDELTRKLSLHVRLLTKKGGGGEMRISYSRAEELDGVLQKLRSTS